MSEMASCLLKVKDTLVCGRVAFVGCGGAWIILDLLNGDFLRCDGDQDTIEGIAGSLDLLVEVRGDAWLDGSSLKKSRVVVTSFRLLQPTKIAEGFRLLRREFGHFFEDIEEINAHDREKRGENIRAKKLN